MISVSTKNASDTAAPSWVLNDFGVPRDFVSRIISKFLVQMTLHLAQLDEPFHEESEYGLGFHFRPCFSEKIWQKPEMTGFWDLAHI